MLIQKLVSDIVVPSDFGNITLTHEGVEFVVCAIQGAYIKAVLWQGVMKPGQVTETDLTPEPIFVPYEPSRREKTIGFKELKPLRDGKGGKAKEDFRMSDIYNLIFKGVAP